MVRQISAARQNFARRTNKKYSFRRKIGAKYALVGSKHAGVCFAKKRAIGGDKCVDKRNAEKMEGDEEAQTRKGRDDVFVPSSPPYRPVKPLINSGVENFDEHEGFNDSGIADCSHIAESTTSLFGTEPPSIVNSSKDSSSFEVGALLTSEAYLAHPTSQEATINSAVEGAISEAYIAHHIPGDAIISSADEEAYIAHSSSEAYITHCIPEEAGIVSTGEEDHIAHSSSEAEADVTSTSSSGTDTIALSASQEAAIISAGQEFSNSEDASPLSAFGSVDANILASASATGNPFAHPNLSSDATLLSAGGSSFVSAESQSYGNVLLSNSEPDTIGLHEDEEMLQTLADPFVQHQMSVEENCRSLLSHDGYTWFRVSSDVGFDELELDMTLRMRRREGQAMGDNVSGVVGQLNARIFATKFDWELEAYKDMGVAVGGCIHGLGELLVRHEVYGVLQRIQPLTGSTYIRVVWSAPGGCNNL
ncbi:hypothetical protein BJ508DRAFT_335112 [Ascobolus immersus RN42]|uniref:Uncharacterized protein n=1 Tax=Ascobolus immersus RN42 TaxID=1160509 RepID=A0A3N4HKD4_ASCIM|nr:hypothetical protein BJ508DRAFT_335112 [Ascobolus immersus RN42]